MDLLQSVRKSGSRGGVNFSWDAVKSDTQRENYLGHSLMAPVGRWQKGKDLSWYAKADDADKTPEERAEAARLARKEELRKVKEAEEDAMAKALGLPVPDRENANMVPLGDGVNQREINEALREVLQDDEGEEEVMEKAGAKGTRSRRSRSRSRNRDSRRERGHDVDERREKRRRRSRSRSREHHRSRKHKYRSRSRSRTGYRRRSRSKSGSPGRRRADSRDRKWRDDERRVRDPQRQDDIGRRHTRDRPRSWDRDRRDRRSGAMRSASRSRSPYRASERPR